MQEAQEQNNSASTRVAPFKTPFEMNENEIIERQKHIKKRMSRAVRNYEFYYYEELKKDYADLQKRLDEIREMKEATFHD